MQEPQNLEEDSVLDSDPLLGVSIRDTRDHVAGRIHRRYGRAFSALMVDGTVRYYVCGSSRFVVDRTCRRD